MPGRDYRTGKAPQLRGERQVRSVRVDGPRNLPPQRENPSPRPASRRKGQRSDPVPGHIEAHRPGRKNIRLGNESPGQAGSACRGHLRRNRRPEERMVDGGGAHAGRKRISPRFSAHQDRGIRAAADPRQGRSSRRDIRHEHIVHGIVRTPFRRAGERIPGRGRRDVRGCAVRTEGMGEVPFRRRGTQALAELQRPGQKAARRSGTSSVHGRHAGAQPTSRGSEDDGAGNGVRERRTPRKRPHDGHLALLSLLHRRGNAKHVPSRYAAAALPRGARQPRRHGPHRHTHAKSPLRTDRARLRLKAQRQRPLRVDVRQDTLPDGRTGRDSRSIERRRHARRPTLHPGRLRRDAARRRRRRFVRRVLLGGRRGRRRRNPRTSRKPVSRHSRRGQAALPSRRRAAHHRQVSIQRRRVDRSDARGSSLFANSLAH